jgi:predicted DNA-binding protein (MmcQ/YjbR family)
VRTSEEIHALCTSLPGAEQTFPFGNQVAVYKIGGKMFALVPTDSASVQFSVKCDPDEAVLLREQYEAVTPGYHLNKRHWNSVRVDGSISQGELEEFIETSYQLVLASLPRAVQHKLNLPSP